MHPAEGGDRDVLERLFQLYQHDLSEFRDTWPDADGTYPRDRLRRWLGIPGSAAYLVRAGTRPAGFAVVRPYQPEGWSMADFFVVRAARRRGLGSQAARAVLARHPGDWNIAFQEANPGAARFWRRLARQLDVAHREERVPVPGRPELPPDCWLRLTVRASG